MAKNILFITADQWRGDCLSALGHLVRTPNLDALAAEGVLFANHFANTAPCGPARASIHTGRVQRRHGVTANGIPLAARHANWAREARKVGLEPALFGYTDTTSEEQGLDPRKAALNVSDGVLPGLDPVVLLGKSIWRPTAWTTWLREQGYPIPDAEIELYTGTSGQPEWEDGGLWPAPLRIPAELHDTWFLVDKTIEYVAGRSGWCVHLSLLRPHPPWIAPEPYNRMYPPDELPPLVRATDTEAEATHPWLAFALGQKHARAPADERVLRRLQASYFGLMTEVDHNLGRLFAALRKSGAWDDTLIVFTSDHGEQMGDHWLIGKLGFFDQSYAVPLVIRNPDRIADVQRGKRVQAFTESIDLMPTLLDWLDVETPAQCDGASLLPATVSGHLGDQWRTEAHWEYHFGAAKQALGLANGQCGLVVLRDEHFKYVHFPSLPPLLYDLDEDPEERTNLADDVGCRSRLREATEKAQVWRAAHAP